MLIRSCRHAVLSAAALAALAMLAPSGAAAQRFPALGGAEMRIGAATADDADVGFSVSADGSMGTVWAERLHLLLGLNLFTGDVDRTAGGQAVVGGFRAAGPRLGLRLDFPTATRLTPYLVAQANAHFVWASDVEDAVTRVALEDWHAGGGLGLGLAYAFGVLRTTSASVEARRVAAGEVSHWALELGLRYTPPRDPLAAERMEAERRRIANERRRAPEPPERAIRIPVELIPALETIAREPGSVMRVHETPRGVELELAREAFAEGDTELVAAARAEVARVGAELARLPDVRTSVEASAPDTRTVGTERAVAQGRVEAVRAALLAGGMAGNQIMGSLRELPAHEARSAGSGVRIVVAPAR